MKIIAGGQTGVDRAALDVALELAIPCGGVCAKGRGAEDGVTPLRYPLTELESGDDEARVRQNVSAAQAILVITRKEIRGATALIVRVACELGKPCLVVDLQRGAEVGEMLDWLQLLEIEALHVAGPPESSCPGIHDQALAWLRPGLSRWLELRSPTGKR